MDQIVQFLQQFWPSLSVAGALATVFGFVFQMYRAGHRKEVEVLKVQNSHLQQQLMQLKHEDPKALQDLIAQLHEQVDQALTSKDQLQSEYDSFRRQATEKGEALLTECNRLRSVNEDLTNRLEQSCDQLCQHDRAERARLNLMKRAMKLQGRVWERKVLQGAPRFRSLSERHAAIISVLNLKGGVGKTTITAHLGAALAAKGYRVLLADLDLQGSLSSLFMSESALVQRSKEGKLLQNFLLNLAERRKTSLLDCCVPILDNGSAILPNADSMAYAELNLTMQWLLKLGKRDTRFLLRKALHQKRVTSRFDVVLLDCPPMFNTCCVNALAASDYLLIPVLPSRKAAERVPLLLERLQGLHAVINPQLQVLGVLLNRTHGSTLTGWEVDLWREMQEQAKDRWKLPVHAFETTIRQTTEVRDGEVEFTAPVPGELLHSLFSQLVAEVEARLPGDCHRTPNVSVGPG